MGGVGGDLFCGGDYEFVDYLFVVGGVGEIYFGDCWGVVFVVI